jgi:secretion/DNA translocation related CpaE-like protein
MGRAARSVSDAAAPLSVDGEPPDRAGGPAAPMTPSGRLRPHPLFVTTDPDLLDDLLRIAAYAGVTPDVAPDPAGARPWFPLAGRVFIGADMADPCARAGLPRRAGIVLVTRSSGVVGDRSPLRMPDGAGARAFVARREFVGMQDRGSAGMRDGGGAGLRDGAGEPPGFLPTRSDDGAPTESEWDAARRLGADHVAVLPAAEPWLAEQFAAIATETACGRVVAVIGGRGGAGASVLAGGLAVTAARRGLRTLLVDADPLGGGVDLVLGWESLDGLRWPALSQASGRVPAPALVEALPGQSELVILSWDRGEPTTVPPEAMVAALDAGRRGRDLTVVDVPRQLDESSVLALRSADQAYLVVPAEVRACAAAARVAAIARPHCQALSVVVRQPGSGGLSVKDVVAALRLPYAGAVRSDPKVRAALERGEPPAAGGRGSLATLCDKLIDDVVPSPGSAA